MCKQSTICKQPVGDCRPEAHLKATPHISIPYSCQGAKEFSLMIFGSHSCISARDSSHEQNPLKMALEMKFGKNLSQMSSSFGTNTVFLLTWSANKLCSGKIFWNFAYFLKNLFHSIVVVFKSRGKHRHPGVPHLGGVNKLSVSGSQNAHELCSFTSGFWFQLGSIQKASHSSENWLKVFMQDSSNVAGIVFVRVFALTRRVCPYESWFCSFSKKLCFFLLLCSHSELPLSPQDQHTNWSIEVDTKFSEPGARRCAFPPGDHFVSVWGVFSLCSGIPCFFLLILFEFVYFGVFFAGYFGHLSRLMCVLNSQGVHRFRFRCDAAQSFWKRTKAFECLYPHQLHLGYYLNMNKVWIHSFFFHNLIWIGSPPFLNWSNLLLGQHTNTLCTFTIFIMDCYKNTANKIAKLFIKIHLIGLFSLDNNHKKSGQNVSRSKFFCIVLSSGAYKPQRHTCPSPATISGVPSIRIEGCARRIVRCVSSASAELNLYHHILYVFIKSANRRMHYMCIVLLRTQYFCVKSFQAGPLSLKIVFLGLL